MTEQLDKPAPVSPGEKATAEYLRIKSEILTMVASRGGVSFVELWAIDGVRGDCQMDLRPSITIWAGISRFAIEAINELMSEKRLVMKPTGPFVYYLDGCVLKHPIAKQIRDYKTQRWLPVTFSVPKSGHVTAVG
jgi:hypothetical protein